MKLFPFFLFLIFILFNTLNGLNARGNSLAMPVGTIPFITTWKTDNPGTSGDNQITIPTNGGGYNYTVDWGDGSLPTAENGDATHTYMTPGTYTVAITGSFPTIYFNNSGDKDKLTSIDQWGDNAWTTMYSAFYGCNNLQGNFSDSPNLFRVSNLENMFRNATIFNHPIGNWDVSNVQNMISLFSQATAFNQDIGSWNVGNVTKMTSMFLGATMFNQDIGSWDVSNVRTAESMFHRAYAFNQDIGSWNVTSMRGTTSMFSHATSFNQDLGRWDTSRFGYMDGMFSGAISFNQDLGNWDVSNVESMSAMFSNALMFDQDLGNWNVSRVRTMAGMFYNAKLSTANYDSILISWNSQIPLSNFYFGGGNSTYCKGESARYDMINAKNWTLRDGGKQCKSQRPFITTWKTDNPGLSANNQISIPTYALETYNYTVDWGDGTSDTGITGDITHNYAIVGTYQISITGNFPQVSFENTGDQEKILSVNQWGDIEWRSFDNAFFDCTNLDVKAEDTPNLSNVTTMVNMFGRCSSLIGNGSFNDWPMATITNINGIFAGASLFNQPLDKWDVSNVLNMTAAFSGATSFNQALADWKVGKVQSMWDMFSGATTFNQKIGSWDVSNVDDMTGMFAGATSFNQDLSKWDVSKVTYMIVMFAEATSFDQNLENWKVNNLEDAQNMFYEVTLSTQNYDALLIGWDAQNLPNDIPFGGGNSTFCAGEAARSNIIASDDWSITDGGFAGIKLDGLANQIHLESYTLPTITGTNITGNEMYYTGPNGTGNVYIGGTTMYFTDFSNYPLKLYIYDSGGGIASSCTDQKDFLLTLSSSCTPPIADKPLDVVTCESYILPDLGSDHSYFTASNAGGELLRAGDPVFSSQTIYVYTGSGDCYDESTFTVTINPSLCKIPISKCHILFPQFITPNGDGFNDRFLATKNPCGRTGLLSVHDRYGRMLFMTQILENGWDGSFEGNLLPETDYWYRFVDSDSGKVSKGHFSLIR